MTRIVWLLLPLQLALASAPTGDQILRRIDDNITSENKMFLFRMIVHGRRSSRTVQARTWVQGTEKSFTEYLAPPREKGTKMLKLGNQLWTYSPQADRTIRIAGHILRQSVMGSDLSYEDLMEDPRLSNLYTAQVVGEEPVNGRPCWVLQLTAKGPNIAYHSRRIWVDKERMIILKENRYAKSGKLLKTALVKKVVKIRGRWWPKHIVFKDQLRKGGGTEFIFESIEFDVKIPPFLFTKAALRK